MAHKQRKAEALAAAEKAKLEGAADGRRE
jgi:hypothetical protein